MSLAGESAAGADNATGNAADDPVREALLNKLKAGAAA